MITLQKIKSGDIILALVIIIIIYNKQSTLSISYNAKFDKYFLVNIIIIFFYNDKTINFAKAQLLDLLNLA